MNQLKNKAMLADLTIRMAPTRKSDRQASKDVAATHNADADMWTTSKSLLPPDAPKLKKVKQVCGAWAAEHRVLTLPWMDSGPRILSSALYFKYSQKMAQFEADFLGAVDLLVLDYPELQRQAAIKQGTAYNPAEYLSTEEFRKRFSGGVNYFPLPDVADMRYDIGDAELARIKEDTQNSLNAALDLAMADVWTRIKTVVSAMAEKLRGYKVTAEGVEVVFRDSLVQNVRDLVEVLPLLNITDNPDIAEFTAIMKRTLCQHEAEQLRNSEATRNQTAAAAEAILTQMEDFI